MHLLPFLYSTLLSLLALSPIPTTAAKPKTPKDAILLSAVRTLTLRSAAKTSHRRVSAIPQLTCTGPGCAHYSVDIMRCTNQGSAYSAEDIEWSCVASLPEEFKLGSTEVTCEGYESRDDEYVLKGSCGVEYRLLLTDAGEEKYGSPGWFSSKPKGNGKGVIGHESESWGLSQYLFVVIFLGVLFWILYSAYTALPTDGNRPPRRQGGFFGGGWGPGGGGGGDGNNPGDPWDPPPPYPGKPRQQQRVQQGWRPGFWSGALGGAAAGYMAGQQRNQRQEPLPIRGGGWFGGNTGVGGDYTTPPRMTRSSSSTSFGTRHESTGFGSTSRR